MSLTPALIVALLGGWRARVRALGFPAATRRASPRHYAVYVALWAFLPACGLWLVWRLVAPGLEAAALTQAAVAFAPDDPRALADAARAYATQPAPPAHLLPLIDAWRAIEARSASALMACASLVALGGLAWAWRRGLNPRHRARHSLERGLRALMFAAAAVAVLTTFGVALSLATETLRFFTFVPLSEFLFGLHWSPQIALREGQVGASGSFGALPLLAGTALITFIALLVAAPIGLFAAITTAEYASPRLRAVLKPTMEALAGVPTIVYGFFAALVLAPAIREAASAVGLEAASESALAAGIVMGVMIAPYVSSLADDVLAAVPQEIRRASYALGATQSETILRVVLPAAAPGLASALLLAFSRAIGETMIVVMAAGLAANLTINPLEAVTTVTAQIVALLVGDQEFDSPRTLAAFALGATLFLATLAVNALAVAVLRRHRGYE